MITASALLERGPEWIGAAPHHDARRERPRLADRDDFHRPPAGFEHARPGTVLRSRDVDLAFLGLVPQRLRAVQLLYRTTDFEGRPEANVTTVVVPAERTPTRPMPLLSYQCAIDAVSARCFPSYAMRRGARALGALAQLELLLIAGCLAEGWAVAIPDHEGPDGCWGTPRDPGYRILDGLRAALAFEPLHLAQDTPIGLWGYSGGGLSTAWAAEVHAEYAPELTLSGVVLGSPVGDLRHTFTRLNGSFFSGLPALVVSALSHAYPGLDAVISRHTTADGRRLLDSLRSMTTGWAVLRMRHRHIDEYIDLPLHEMLELDELQDMLNDISLGTRAPRSPILIVQAVHDRIIAVEDIDKLAAYYSENGSDVTYHRDLLSEHMLLHAMSAPMALRWLTDRFAGRPRSDNLLRTTWPTLLNPVTYRGMSRLLLVAARVVTGRGISRRPL